MGTSKSNTITHCTGVPQGSVLGPLLLSIFTTPVGSLICNLSVMCHQFADDTWLYTSLDMGNGHSTLQLTTGAEVVTRWHLEYGQLLNLSKSEAMITGSRHQVHSFNTTPGLCVAGSIVPFVNKIKLLVVTVDNHLSFDQHVSYVVRSCNYHIRSLRHIRSLTDHVKSVTASRASHVAAPTIWNNLPDSVKAADSFSVFKRRLKCYLFSTRLLINRLVPTGVFVSQPCSSELRRLKFNLLYYIAPICFAFDIIKNFCALPRHELNAVFEPTAFSLKIHRNLCPTQRTRVNGGM
jgi:Reverse transcriptase (RNA-dependent DNA polymerase)